MRKEVLGVLKATSTREGDVTGAVNVMDKTYAHLVKGDEIDMIFAAPTEALEGGERESYIFEAAGFYHKLRADMYPEVDTSEKWKEEIKEYKAEWHKQHYDPVRQKEYRERNKESIKERH